MLNEKFNNLDNRKIVARQLLNNEDGKGLIEWLKAFYDIKEPSGNSNLDYFKLGKRRAILELEELVNSIVKDK